MDQNTSSSSENADAESLKNLLQDLRADAARLLRQEIQLARTEISGKASKFGRHATGIGAGALVAYAGGIVLLIGLGDGAAALLRYAGSGVNSAAWVGHAGVGLIVLIIGWIMYAQAKRSLRASSLVPEKTLQSIREDSAWMRNKFRRSHESA
jgi:hypothetical protein